MSLIDEAAGDRDFRKRKLRHGQLTRGILHAEVSLILTERAVETPPKRSGEMDGMNAHVARHFCETQPLGETIVQHIAGVREPVWKRVGDPLMRFANEAGKDLQRESLDQQRPARFRVAELAIEPP